jgi:hypothetical protein
LRIFFFSVKLLSFNDSDKASFHGDIGKSRSDAVSGGRGSTRSAGATTLVMTPAAPFLLISFFL